MMCAMLAPGEPPLASLMPPCVDLIVLSVEMNFPISKTFAEIHSSIFHLIHLPILCHSELALSAACQV